MAICGEVLNDSRYLFKNVLPYFKKTVSFSPPIRAHFTNATPLFNAIAFDKEGQPVQVSYPKYAIPFSTWVKHGFDEIGLQEAQDFNSGSLMGHQFYTMTIYQTHGSRSSSESAFLSQNRQWTFYLYAMAKRILFDNQNRARATNSFGQQLEKSSFQRVSFTLRNLLMVSSIGPSHVPRTYGIDLITDLSGVGQNIDPLYLLSQVEAWFHGGNGDLTNPSIDYVAFEKLPLRSRSGFFEENNRIWLNSQMTG
ncbi:Glucose-methanol-choline oxidoreductase [Penicillium antarcticum]|uniref:Glucose-methanol-choline oxidoreductase n=1 Tax=Penicillium antarcticum TaxID=416450 RepID=UPI00238DF5BA|nr:Glucose-methanol-choline oxidoreductase [Penicillium antarcticum]KAJ5307048.1 Glucose-methanol-choline oxidoreductase [Penicillium antarcticum]